jgi:hypothetical protein
MCYINYQTFQDILDRRQRSVLLNNMIIIKTVYKTIFSINTISLPYCKDEVSNYSVTIYHRTATLFSCTFLLGLMMTQDEMKHVTILQKQGYYIYNKYSCVDCCKYHHIITRHSSVRFWSSLYFMLPIHINNLVWKLYSSNLHICVLWKIKH